MKYIKIFEDFGLNKDWVLAPLDDDELKDIYEYLVDVNADPKIFKINIDDLDYTWLSKRYINRILYTDNEYLKNRFLINRSTQPKDLPYKIVPDIEKEESIKQLLNIKKFNI